MSLFNWIQQGGSIMYLLLALNILGWSIMVWKLYSLWYLRKHQDQYMQELKQYISRIKENISLQERLALALDYLLAPYNKGMTSIRVIASVAPLLGLLGTVWGILSSFRIIAIKGLENPNLFAEGISLALVTTVGGLVVAIPHLIGFNYLKSLLNKTQLILEQHYLMED